MAAATVAQYLEPVLLILCAVSMVGCWAIITVELVSLFRAKCSRQV